jgi:hypothetical protein
MGRAWRMQAHRNHDKVAALGMAVYVTEDACQVIHDFG